MGAPQGEMAQGRQVVRGATAAGAALLWVAAIALISAAAVGLTAQLGNPPALDPAFAVPWWAFAVAFAVAQLSVVRIRYRRQRTTITFVEIPLVLGLVYVAPVALVAARVVGEGAAFAVRDRPPVRRLLLGLATSALTTVLAIVIFREVSGVDPGRFDAQWAGATLATIQMVGVSLLSERLALALDGRPRPPLMPKLELGLLSAIVQTSIALIAVTLLMAEDPDVALLLPPALALVVAYRAYREQQLQQERIGFLYETARTLQRPFLEPATIERFLRLTRSLLRSDVAEIVLESPDAAGSWLRAAVGPGDRVERLRSSDGELDGELAAVLAARPGSPVARIRHDGSTGTIVAPLRGEREVVGALRLVRRLSDAGPYDTDSTRFLESIGVHAGLALDRSRLLARLTSALAEQRRIAAERDRANLDLTRASDAKSAFLGTFAHELRTPLHAILIATDLILDPNLGAPSEERTRELVGTIRASGQHLISLIDDLVDLARIEAGRIRLNRIPVNLAVVLEEARREVGPLAFEKGVRLDLPSESDVTLFADPLRVRQVLLNLLTNGVKFTRSGGLVRVRAEVAGASARISIQDTGIGIAPGDLARIFEPFEQGSSAIEGGAGLGLAISRVLAELHGGRLEATSEPGVGSTFVLTLPTAASPPEADEPPVPVVDEHSPASAG